MKKNKTHLSYCGYDIIDFNSKVIGSFTPKNILKFDDLMKSCDIGLSTVILNKKFRKIFIFKFKNQRLFIVVKNN